MIGAESCEVLDNLDRRMACCASLAVRLPGEIERRQEARDRAVAHWRGVRAFIRPATGAERNYLARAAHPVPPGLQTIVEVCGRIRRRRWTNLVREVA